MNTYEIIWSENTPDGYQVFQKDVEAKDEITAIRTILADPTSATSNKTLLSMVRFAPYKEDYKTKMENNFCVSPINIKPFCSS